jgi:hypothetical protein
VDGVPPDPEFPAQVGHGVALVQELAKRTGELGQRTFGLREGVVSCWRVPDELERRLRARLHALGPAPRAELLHVLMLPDFDRVNRIGSYWTNPATLTFAELPRWTARRIESFVRARRHAAGGRALTLYASGGRRTAKLAV